VGIGASHAAGSDPALLGNETPFGANENAHPGKQLLLEPGRTKRIVATACRVPPLTRAEEL
jgi:hypothetical protein